MKQSDMRNSGFSLISVAALGSVAMLMLLALSSLVIPMYQRASQMRYYTVVRSSAEAALDYAVGQINQAIAAGQTSPLDDPTQDGTGVTSSVPAQALGNSAATVSVTVNNTEPPPTSSIYNPEFDVDPNPWRVISATATYAGLRKTIKVILQPEPDAGATATTPKPYFSYAMFGRSSVTTGGNLKTDGYNSLSGDYTPSPTPGNRDQYGGDIASNTRVDLGSNTTVGGDVWVFSEPKGSTTAVVLTAGSNTVINDRVEINGIGSGITATDGPEPVPGDNVLARGQGTAARTDDYATPIDPSQSMDPFDVPPARTPPADYNIVQGSISWTGNEGWVGQPGSQQVADLGSLAVSGSQVLHIRPGNYKISSLSITGSATIVVEPNADGSYSPAMFYVEGNAPGSNVIQVKITGNGIVNSSKIPANMQFWYNGSKTIQIAGNGSFYGVVYAPNSDVKVTGNGNVFGAVVGNNVDARTSGSSSNIGVHFDKALLNPDPNWRLTYDASAPTFVVGNLKTISWQEL